MFKKKKLKHNSSQDSVVEVFIDNHLKQKIRL